MSKAPLFSIVTPVYEPPLDVLGDTIASVLAQEHAEWEWLLVDDCSPSQAVRDLIREHSARDPRIRLIERETNGHIVAASNDGIEAATGEFIVLLDHDDLLTPDALAANARMIEAHDDVDYLYSDEDKIDDEGRLYDEFRKPDWSPERLRGQMYTSHLSVMRTDVVRRVGAFREGYDGSQDHDLALRVGEVARRVVHIPRVLYHWRAVEGSASADINAKPYATIAGAKAVQSHLDRLGIEAEVGQGPVPGHYRVHRRLDPAVRVSVVIPTIGQSALIWGTRRVMVVEAVRSLLEHTGHDNLEIVIVHDVPTPPEVLDELREVAGDKLVLERFAKPFNYSEKMNVGCLRATGDRLVFLNDDVEVISDGWIEQLVAPLDEPDVGMTGARLYFSDTTVQHAGHVYAWGHYHHPFRELPRESYGPFGALIINRETSGVTAACAAMRRDTFLEVGGFAEGLPVNFNDVDLCYKVRRQGLRIVYVAAVELFHFESRTREGSVHDWERNIVRGRWGFPEADPFVDVPRKRRRRKVRNNDDEYPGGREPLTSDPVETGRNARKAAGRGRAT
ncbi:glycosyltransferase [Nocardioides seonyuensis]|uniref:Glycosyltransferase n=1 Tax=Nocardioides seonyuensis TaxID=2518371 RepID=A0A4P7IB78_9ACTN|nr:glycosyltransferase [Nocardioides seonyuensis]QBX54304.1 glycosyltransferase [Nocardioides seonyuensis]